MASIGSDWDSIVLIFSSAGPINIWDDMIKRLKVRGGEKAKENRKKKESGERSFIEFEFEKSHVFFSYPPPFFTALKESSSL
jgi:hypothetical protein